MPIEMRVGIIADTHDKKPIAERAVRVFNKFGVSVVIHCGDITTPGIIRLFADFEVHAVLGNNDEPNKAALRAAIRELNNGSTLHGLRAELTFNGVRMCVVHGVIEEAVYEQARSGSFEYVFHGHFHERTEREINGTTVINPGAHRSVAILDTDETDHWFVQINTE